MLLTTHYMEEAERLCDRVAIVDHGRIIALGTPRELIARLQAPHIIEFTTEPAVDESARSRPSRHRRAPPARRALVRRRVARSPTRCRRCFGASTTAGARLVTLSTHRATLEDLFVALTGRELRDE